MDAAEYVEQASAEHLRGEIYQTSEALTEHVDQLYGVLQSRLERLQEPFHIMRRTIQDYPLISCGVAWALGALTGRTRLHVTPLRMVTGMGRAAYAGAQGMVVSLGVELLEKRVREVLLYKHLKPTDPYR